MQGPVHVLGQLGIQNLLLTRFLAEEFGLTCDFHPVSDFQSLCKKCTDEKCLILCAGQDPESISR